MSWMGRVGKPSSAAALANLGVPLGPLAIARLRYKAPYGADDDSVGEDDAEMELAMRKFVNDVDVVTVLGRHLDLSRMKTAMLSKY